MLSVGKFCIGQDFSNLVSMTVALSRHALKNSFFFKILGIGFHLICPALIGVKRSSIRTISRDFDCFSLRFQYAFS